MPHMLAALEGSCHALPPCPHASPTAPTAGRGKALIQPAIQVVQARAAWLGRVGTGVILALACASGAATPERARASPLGLLRSRPSPTPAAGRGAAARS